MCAECPSFTWALFISHEKRFPLRIAILGISAHNQIKLQNKTIPSLSLSEISTYLVRRVMILLSR